MTDEETWELIYRAPDATEAHLMAQAIDVAGIPVRLGGGVGAVAFGDLPMDALRVDVRVPESRLDAAREVVERFYAERRPAGEEPPPPWKCESCGEPNPDGFQICWSCRTRRSQA